MSSLGSVLKNEITRLARKEIRAHVEPLRKANANHRREIAELKRQLAALQREAKSLGRSVVRAAPAEPAEDAPAPRFSAKGLRPLRERLGLSAGDFARLAGVSPQSIYNWESGVTRPRPAQIVVLAQLRSIGKREAASRLEALSAGAPGKRGKAAGTG